MSNRFTVSIAHTFEAAHRLPKATGPCRHLHGHSWTAVIFLAGPDRGALDSLIDAGAFKCLMSEWIGRHLDHACLLGADDPLLAAVSEHENRLFVFGDVTTHGLIWPTPEAVAELLYRQAAATLAELGRIDADAVDLGYRIAVGTAPGVRIAAVRVRDQAANSVTFTGAGRRDDPAGAE